MGELCGIGTPYSTNLHQPALCSMFASVVLSAIALSSILVQALVLPSPPGPFSVSLSLAEIVDSFRDDPYAPNSQPRRLMLSIFSPTRWDLCQNTTVPYMPTPVAEAYDAMFKPYVPIGTFESLSLSVCSHMAIQGTSPRPKDATRVLVFSPGLGNSRLEYNTLAMAIAAKGWTVITIDHPYDAVAVTFLDGTTVYAANISTDAQIDYDVSVRTADMRFVVNQVRANTSLVPINGAKVESIQTLGHSLGGATALDILLQDDADILSAINLDGQLFGPVVTAGVPKPFLLIGNQQHNLTSDPTWASAYNASTGIKVDLDVRDSVHGTFSDLPFLAAITGLDNGSTSEELGLLVGTIPGLQVNGLLAELVDTWMSRTGAHATLDHLVTALGSIPHVDVQNYTQSRSEK